ncbi:MAG: transporter [Desulfobacterales bacterium]|nr:tripartite tricarboxylate transporter permease [Deltaproteobacteria bacterium]NNK95867.1 transporter [Desulfobacterales bacterium]
MTVRTLFDVLWSTQLGIIVGMLPGLTATMGVALMTTLTFSMPPENAILILICMYIGAIYGGGRSAILLNIPGTPANAATAMDGHPLAMQGEAGRAIGISTTGSFLGSIIGMVMLAFFTPLLGNFALNFQSFEFFWLAVFGIVISGNLTAPKDPIKGWISGFLGLFIALIGMEGIHGFVRFSFGNTNLSGGINLIPAMVGAFGFAEILSMMKHQDVNVVKTKIERIIPRFKTIFQYRKTIVRSGMIGTLIGAIPGVGEDIAAWVSYDFAKRGSKTPGEFGNGSVEGLISSETGNNAAVAGAVIPVLSLGIPGSAPAAVLLAAMFIHGVRPGPMIMIESPDFVYKVVAMVFLATCAMFILGLSMVKYVVKVLQVPRTRLMPIIFTLCVVGSFAIQSRIFDVRVMVFFGILGFLMLEMEYPVAPMILGLILGTMLDTNFRRALVIAEGEILPFISRPICIVLIVFIVVTLVSKTGWFQVGLKKMKMISKNVLNRRSSDE